MAKKHLQPMAGYQETIDWQLTDVRIRLTGYDQEQTRLGADEVLARYNKIRADLTLRSPCPKGYLLVTVRRTGSKLGAENYYTVPVWLDDLKAGEYGVEFASFDAFNVPFQDLSIELTDHASFGRRLLNDNALQRSKSYSRVHSASDPHADL